MYVEKMVYPGRVIAGVAWPGKPDHRVRYFVGAYGPDADPPRRLVWEVSCVALRSPMPAAAVMSDVVSQGCGAVVVAVTPTLSRADAPGAWCDAVVVGADAAVEGGGPVGFRDYLMPDPDGLRLALIRAIDDHTRPRTPAGAALAARPAPTAAAVRPDPNAPPPVAFPDPEDVIRWHEDGGRADG